MNDNAPTGALTRAGARNTLRIFILALADLIEPARLETGRGYNDLPEPQLVGKTEGKALRVGSAAETTRFWAKVRIGAPDECWTWQGSTQASGYGIYHFRGLRLRAHRYAYVIANGSIDAGPEVLHSCDNRLCVNPLHLRAGTHRENVDDAVSRQRHARGERNPRSQLTLAQVHAIRTSEETAAVLAARFGVAANTIHQIRRRRTWRFPEAEPPAPANEQPSDPVHPAKASSAS